MRHACFTLHPLDTHSVRREIATDSTVHIDNYDFPRMQTWSIDDYFQIDFPSCR